MKLLTGFRVFKRSMTGIAQNAQSVEDYVFEKVLVVSKTTRLEIEQQCHPNTDDCEIRELILEKGSGYLLQAHEQHKKFEKNLIQCLEKMNVEVKLVDRHDRPKELIDWADTIISIGGDGTFLMAANKILDQSKPVFGFNSFPERSTGYLCLPKVCSENISKTLNEIRQRRFTWAYRTRIKIQVYGRNINPICFSIHDKSKKLETECVKTVEKCSSQITEQVLDIPYLALNEVFIAESSPATVSYLDVAVDDREFINTKNSGLCICTGSGSSSWNYTMNRLSYSAAQKLFTISGYGVTNVEEIVEKYNNSLRFNADDLKMSYTIRDMIPMPTWPKMPNVSSKAYANKMEIRSQCQDGLLVIDGGCTYSFNNGAIAVLKTDPSYMLKSIRLIDDGSNDC